MVVLFQGEHRFLSNFYPATVEAEGYLYPTVEHAYQAMKTQEEHQRAEIRALPAEKVAVAKRLGKSVRMREGWEEMKLSVMDGLLHQKFQSIPLREMLLTTEGDLIEGNTWHDNYWGMCFCAGRCGGIVGQNHLGRLLVALRAEILAGAGGK